MCKAFYEAGASVAVAARRPDVNEESVAEIKAVCPALPGQQVIPVTLDVTDAANVEAAYNEVISSFGKLDILVNNAGRSAGGDFETHTDEDWQADLDVKLFAMIRLTRLAFPAMKEAGWGRVITVLNTGAKNPAAGSSPTSVSRAAQMALTKVLANEGGPHNVNVSCLMTGLLWTDQINGGKREPGGEFEQASARRIPLGRLGDPEEFAAMAVFLASERSSYITGAH